MFETGIAAEEPELINDFIELTSVCNEYAKEEQRRASRLQSDQNNPGVAP